MSGAKYPKVVGYELIQQIGGGGFSTVFRAVNVQEHLVAACKLISLSEETTERERKAVDKEMRVHSALKHIYVLEFLNAVVVEPKLKHRYVPGIYMLLEFAAGGDLFDKIAPDVGVGEDVAHYYFRQLAAGMEYIHSQGVCHRDLKPENLLLDVTGTLKISDFGLSAVFRLKDSGKTRMLSERCGSLPYVAPELNTNTTYHAEPIDVWGIGVILFTLLTGNTPWDEPTDRSMEYRSYVSGSIFAEPPWNQLGHDALSLIRGLLEIDPLKRLTLADVHRHPWYNRPSQLAPSNVIDLADMLTESLRNSGDLSLVSPEAIGATQGRDADGDEMMMSPSHQSQFTQSLFLFSQTQSGPRYTPHLTRFYTSLAPQLLISLIQESLEELNVRCKQSPPPPHVGNNGGALRLRIGGYDRRKVVFKGWVELEPFTYHGQNGSFCVMQRDVGNPISWRRLWKDLIQAPAVEPHVLRK